MTPAAVDGLFLHASAVVVDGGAVLFLGHSTAGKSTIARKLGAVLPVLADDAVFVAPGANGIWRGVDGGMRFGHGSSPAEWMAAVRQNVQASGAVPLRGFFRIHQAKSIRTERMPPIALGRYLMDAAMEIDVQRKYGLKPDKINLEPIAWESVMKKRREWFRHTAHLARTCPGWHLWFAVATTGNELGHCLRQCFHLESDGRD